MPPLSETLLRKDGVYMLLFKTAFAATFITACLVSAPSLLVVVGIYAIARIIF